MELPRSNLTNFYAVFCKKHLSTSIRGKAFFGGTYFHFLWPLEVHFSESSEVFQKCGFFFQKCGGISLVPDGLQQCCRKYFLIKLAPRFSRIVGEPPAISKTTRWGLMLGTLGLFWGGKTKNNSANNFLGPRHTH